MRRFLFAIPLLLSAPALAQSQAANPVEPFSYGVRVGTAKNPVFAALSSVVPSAQAGPTQAAAPVEMFSYGRRVGTQSNPIYINLGTALSGYLKTDGSTPASFLQLTCMTTAQVKALSASDGAIACVNDLGSADNHYSNIVVHASGSWTQISWGSAL